MKTLHAKDSQGKHVPGWMFGTFKGWHVGLDKRRQITGWELRSPDGCIRFSEGNWQQFVPFANQVLENYGLRPTVS